MLDFLKGVFKLVLGLAVLVGATAAVVRLLFLEVAVIPHDGMAPNMETGDEVLIWVDAEPELGDLVICDHPTRAEFIIGRVIALGGSEVRADRGNLEIDGSVTDVDWEATETFVDAGGRTFRVNRGTETLGGFGHAIYQREGYTLQLPVTRVQGGRLYLLSDNRSYASRDSRTYGAIDPSTCLGTLFMRWRPSETSPNKLGNWLDILR